MLRAFGKQRRRPTGYEETFLSHYDQILTWARQLTRGNEAEAEDLVQDTFIDFTHSQPDLSAVRNLDGFLYTIVRNIHRSQLQRHLRRRNILLTVVDYDSADLGLRAAAPARLLEIREQLHRVCQFACERKAASKAGSILILRFFHGYYPAEIASITRWDRATVDARLGLVRREARAYVEGPNRLRTIDSSVDRASMGAPAGFESDAVLGELRARIFSAVDGDCLSESSIRKLYRNAGLDAPCRGFLSHLVSCAKCLDIVNNVLGLDSSSQRGFGESEGPQPPSLGTILGRPEKSRRKRPQLGKWKRSATGIFEHYPRELMMVVNGVPIAWQTVNAERNELSIRLQQNEPVEFVEILSDQEVRLLSLAVASYPPDAGLELRNEVTLSGNRSLLLVLRFETLGPEIHVSYVLPGTAETPTALPAMPTEQAPRLRWRDMFRPRLALCAIALALCVLLLQPVGETTVSAATLLLNAQTWERSAGTQSGLVVHRSIHLEERAQGRSEILSRRRVEIWRDGRRDTRMRRLFDEHGTLLASSSEVNTTRPSSAADVWKFDPSADNFELLAGDLSQVRVVGDGGSVQLSAPSAGLTIQRDNWHAVAGFVVFGGHEYQFTEIAFELMPPESSPLTQPVVVEASGGISNPAPAPPVTGVAARNLDLEDIEVECRYALHRIGADIGYPIEIRRSQQGAEAGLIVAGVVPSAERKQEIVSALGNLTAVTFELKTEDQLGLEALPPAKSSSEIRVASARSPIAAQLLNYFGQPMAVEQFTHAVFAANESLMSHAWALRRLGERYPSPAAGSLSSASRRKLDEMISGHRRALSKGLRQESALVEPVLLSFVELPLDVAPAGTLFDLAQHVEQCMIALLSGAGPKGPTAQNQADLAARELLGALRNLRSQLGDVP